MLERIARSLDLDRPALGERTTWTARTEHGVHEIELVQAVTGTRVLVDGEVIARRPPWSFAQEAFAFSLDGAPATLVVHPDTRKGTVRTALLVNGEPIRANVPGWKLRRTPPIAWTRWAGYAGYAVAGTLLAGAVLGDPFRSWAVVALGAALDVLWYPLVRALDPLALLPAWLDQITRSRSAMLLLGLELLAVVTIARQERVKARLPLVRSGRRRWQVLGWTTIAFVVAALPLLLAG